MNDPLYLSRIRLSNFRTYGEDFEIEIPDAPGLTVVCGMNGLGKTAFFDAIEWGLLGEIKRLSPDRIGKPEGSPLTREGAPSRSHRVELCWGTDHQVVRTEREAPTLAELTALLKAPEWLPQIHDLAVYLRLTHFLPQATRERFLEQDKKDQWSLLQGPAGVERLERFRKMLDDGKARNAFERCASTLETQVLAATKRMEDWKRLLADYERWSAVATAVTAVSPAELEPVLAELEAKAGLSRSTQEPAARLSVLRTALEAARNDLRNRLRALASWETSTRRYLEIVQRLRPLEASSPNWEKELGQQRTLEAAAKEKVATMRNAVRKNEDKKRQTDQQALAVLTVLDAESRRATAAKARPQFEEKIAQLNKQLGELSAQRTGYRQQQQNHEHATKGVELVRQNLLAVEHLRQEYETYIRRLRQWEGQASEAKSATQRRAATEAKRSEAEKKAAGFKQEIAVLSAQLKVEQQTIGEAQSALAEVVRHLDPGATTCPVCAHIHSPGELLKKAQGSIERYDKRSADLIGALHKQQAMHVETVTELTHAMKAIAELDHWLATYTRERAELDQLKEKLFSHAGIGEASLETLPAVLEERREATLHQQKDYREKVAATKPSDEAILAAQQFDAVEKSLKAELKTATAELGAIIASLQECEAKLTAAKDLIAGGGGLPTLSQYREALLPVAAQLEADIRDAKGQIEEEENRAAAISREIAERIAKQAADTKLTKELTAEVGKLLSTWREFGFPAEPNESEVQEARRKGEKEEAEHEQLLEKISAIAVGLEAWAKREQVAGLENNIARWRTEVGANSTAHCTQMLQQQLSDRGLALQRARAAQRRAEQVAARLMTLSGHFSESALEPLSARITAFNRLISPFPYEFRISPHVTATRTRTEARVGVPGIGTNRMFERDPEWWLSEGQMSAMGLSVLLGASTVYRWSRWRALLLDDPLQNTDLIHAAAFGDVIRSLMKDEGFQVIVSTHDHDEAEFLIRKCRRANLPVRKLELLGLGPSGVRYNLRDS